jgi:hypothetical protein
MAEDLASYFAGLSAGLLFALGVYARASLRSRHRRTSGPTTTQAWGAQRFVTGHQWPQDARNGPGKVKVPECACTVSATSLSPQGDVTRVVTSCPVHGQGWQ